MNEVEIESIGKLKPHPDVPEEWLISKPILIPYFDEIKLEFTLQCDLETDKSFLVNADKAISNFLSKNVSDRLSDSLNVFNNYREIQDYYDTQTWGAPPLQINHENEIWQYVNPGSVFICRGSNIDDNIYILITCECDWEPEHGLQLVFKNGLELTKVSGIDYDPTE
ncbi:MAG TPA: hypothetical protein PKY59_06270 [Pyrinomonadaceae bacterium]|nr:hypothetical protein [Pyrinomonadaceae bacterium]